jgi:hypothetical protein
VDSASRWSFEEKSPQHSHDPQFFVIRMMTYIFVEKMLVTKRSILDSAATLCSLPLASVRVGRLPIGNVYFCSRYENRKRSSHCSMCDWAATAATNSFPKLVKIFTCGILPRWCSVKLPALVSRVSCWFLHLILSDRKPGNQFLFDNPRRICCVLQGLQT